MKTKPPQLRINRQILDEASAWFVDFRVGDVDQYARERFDEWLRQSPEHIRAYMEIAKTYVELPALSPHRKVDVGELIACARTEGNVVPFEQTAHPSEPRSSAAPANIPPCPQRRGATFWTRKRSLAASVAVIALAGSLLAWFALYHYPTYTTQIGERRSIKLTDGSTIDLNARSQIRIKFSATERDVELLEGQALFEVAKDKARPFIVRSGDAWVRAVGTQFDVNRKATATVVTVIEGRVAVVMDDAGRSPTGRQNADIVAPLGAHAVSFEPTLLSAGEQVTVTAHAVSVAKHTDIAAATAWTRQRLIFEGSALNDVVDEFNRYNQRQLVIGDPELEDFHVSGVYSSTDPASLIRFLRAQPGIQVIETNEAVHITKK
jgi:transmembrane sensor